MELLGGAEALPEDILRILKWASLTFFWLGIGFASSVSLKLLCQETLREILVDSDLIELNKMLAEGVLLEKIIKHFFQVKIWIQI